MTVVTIVIPIYNAEGFIESTVGSVVRQTYSDWELLLINDGSKDKSADICRELVSKDNRIHYYKKENGGQGSARNLGIRYAKGEYIAFLDADDLWDKEKLEKQVAFMHNKPEIDLVFTAGKVFHENVENTSPYPLWVKGKQDGDPWKRELFQRSGIINSSVIVKKEVFTKDLMFDESDIQKGTEDWDLWLRLALNNHVFYGLDEALVYYREHPGGIHFQSERMFKGKVHTYIKHEKSDQIPDWLKRKQFRFTYRELMNIHKEKEQWEEIIPTFNKLKKHVSWSFGDAFLWLFKPISSPKFFYFLSTKVIFRIAYQIEKIAYIFRK